MTRLKIATERDLPVAPRPQLPHLLHRPGHQPGRNVAAVHRPGTARAPAHRLGRRARPRHRFQFLPVLVFGAWAGVISDRADKRKLMLVTQTS